MLAVAFPDDQMQILPYNRVVKDLNGMTPAAFLDALRTHVPVTEAAAATPTRKGAGGDVSGRPLVRARPGIGGGRAPTRPRRST